jgi:hypothetical protein
MVQAPHGMDGPQASGLLPKPKAQGLQEKRQQSQLCCHRILGHCSFSHHHPQQSLRGSIGHACNHERQRVMVRASVHMEFIVSMCGWAIRHGTRHFNLPIPQLPTDLHHHPTSSLLPYQDLGNGDRQIGSLASSGETSCHLPRESQEIQDSREKASIQEPKIRNQWSNHVNLPVPGALHRLQGWLSSGGVSLTLLRSTHLGPLPSGLPK